MASPVIYGTAFPIAPGIFVSAAHVFEDAHADGRAVALVQGHPERTRIHVVTDTEVFRGIDLALMACPEMNDLVPIPIDFTNRLTECERNLVGN